MVTIVDVRSMIPGIIYHITYLRTDKRKQLFTGAEGFGSGISPDKTEQQQQLPTRAVN